MKNSDTLEVQVIELETLDVNLLPELQGWRETQLKLVEENPFVPITDNKSFEEAKKSRTTLVTARTTIEKQEKAIASKLRDFRTKVADASKELILITLPHEEKQQEEVRRYEAEKEAERAEKERIEKERKDAIRKDIDTFYSEWKSKIQNMDFPSKENLSIQLAKSMSVKSEQDMEEFELDWTEKTKLLNSQFDERVTYLKEKEDQRIENERLTKEREKLEAERLELERQAKEREDKEREAKRKEDEKIKEERRKLEAEKAEIEKAKAEHEAKLEAERKAKEDAERKKREEAEQKAAKKRIEALRPEKEKLTSFIESIDFTIDQPELKDEKLNQFIVDMKMELGRFKNQLDVKLSTIN
tara:strand:+ start:4486 stop:5559 length:1074 start_codon:yes stop_codon:yes gene_type:complete